MSAFVERLRHPSPEVLYGLIAAGLILLSAVVRESMVRDVVAPNILCDEFIYAGIARGLADGDGYAYRGVHLDFGWLYPLLIAPGWLAARMDTSYEAAKALNVAAMSLAGVPAYLWARRFASPPWAVLATLLVLLVPAYAFNGLIMTENAAYPTFLAGAFGIALALERPRLGFQALAIVLVGLAWATRYQNVVLVPTLVLAAVLVLALDWRAGLPRAELRRRALLHGRMVGALAAVGLAFLLYKRVTTGYFYTALGSYADVRNNVYPWRDVFRWAILHLGELSLAVGVVPFAALLLLAVQGVLGRTKTDAERAYIAVAASGVALIALQVGAFAASTAHWVVERYSFYAMPLLLLGLVAWLGRGAPRRPIAATVASAAVAGGLVVWLLHEFRDFLFAGSLPVNTLSLYAFLRWTVHFGGDQDRLIWAVGAVAAVAAAAFVLVPRRIALIALPLGVAITLVAFSRPALTQTRLLSEGTLQLAGTDPTWVDDAVGRKADVAMLITSHPDQYTASGVQLQTEFWNRSVDRVYRIAQSEICPLPGTDLTLDPTTGELHRVGYTGAAEEPPERYYVVNQGTSIFGEQLVTGGTALGAPLALYKAKLPLRLQNSTSGIFADGWMGSTAAYTQYAADGKPGKLQVTLSREAWTGPDKPGRVKIRYGYPGVDKRGYVVLNDPKTVRWTIHSGGVEDVRPAREAAAGPRRGHDRPDLLARRLRVCRCARTRRQADLRVRPRVAAQRSASGCLRTKRAIPRQCQSVRRVRKRRSVTATWRCVTSASGHVPALPAGAGGAVAEVDVLAVEAEALVEAAELLEHRAAQEQEAAEHPVGLDRLGRPLVEVVVAALVLVRVDEEPQRRAADERAADGREAAPRRLPRAVRVAHLRAGDAAALVRLREGGERRDCVRRRLRVGVRDDDQRVRSWRRCRGSRWRRSPAACRCG